MDWTTATSPPEDDVGELLRCPHNQRISPHATACVNCAERSYTNELERGRMSNWTADHFRRTIGSPGGISDNSSVSSFKSMLSPKLHSQLSNEVLIQSAQDLVANAQHSMDAGNATIASTMEQVVDSSSEGVAARQGGGRPIGKTAMYFFFWYFCTLCNDK